MKRKSIAVILLAVALILIVSLVYVTDLNRTKNECVKPANGFLVIASSQGYNDSVGHGAPATHWPVIVVQQRQTVNIVVCNTDTQTHGFQIAHYLDATTELVEPSHALNISFVANESGTFQIYNGSFDTLQLYEQSGELVVMP